jgi:phosphatidylinositol dimannoside acyltransferase
VPPLDLDSVANSKLALRIVQGIGRTTPTSVGHRLAEATADAIATSRSMALVRAVRLNQWVVSGGRLLGRELDEQVRLTLRAIARSTFDLYHLLDDESALRDAVGVTPVAAEWLERSRDEAVVFAVPHTGNFDLAGRSLALQGLRAQVLSVPDPTDAYRHQNDLRREIGLEVTPISGSTLRAAARRLSEGGAVLTGVDRPLARGKQPLTFFGRPALLPDVHVRLAVHSGAPLFAIWVTSSGPGTYEVDGALVELSDERGAEALAHNAERVLAVVERLIAAKPTEWAMPHPVWPEAFQELDKLEAGGAAVPIG